MGTVFKIDVSGFPWAYKDPSAKLDYSIEWEDWLDGDIISSVVWTVASGLTEESSSYSSTLATIWLSGGSAAVTYPVHCQIVTSAGRIDERQFKLIGKER